MPPDPRRRSLPLAAPLDCSRALRARGVLPPAKPPAAGGGGKGEAWPARGGVSGPGGGRRGGGPGDARGGRGGGEEGPAEETAPPARATDVGERGSERRGRSRTAEDRALREAGGCGLARRITRPAGAARAVGRSGSRPAGRASPPTAPRRSRGPCRRR